MGLDAESLVSIIIPTLNEQSIIEGLLRHLTGLHPHEIIVADGGSIDRTRELAAPYACVIQTAAGRGPQLNAGAARATGDILLFLHADVRLAASALPQITRALQSPAVAGGNLDIHYEGGWEARIFTSVNRLRRHFRIFYGDSGIFCRREVFHHLGGYPPWPILEDYAFARRLARHGRLALLDEPIHVSSRRWQQAGLLQTLWLWFWIQTLYLAGVSPHRLAAWYRQVR
ncbi:MAG: TIGR04283 family arsenosugar biosynthesis glycosyltransferase [Acidobacteriia bacterium]|nr:TIGR04283 family arsenosugar biosynthesis glycosyltransferase [Terriglobia bacterium]